MVYAMSDIHGNLKAFNNILNQISLTKNDDLYILGDVIDRKKDGIKLLQEIMEHDNWHMCLGNHEYMMMNALGYPLDPIDPNEGNIDTEEAMKLWIDNGANPTIDALSKIEQSSYMKIINFISQLPIEYDVEVSGKKFKLCHSASEDMYEIVKDFESHKKKEFCVWDRTYTDTDIIEDQDYIRVFGHTPTINMIKYVKKASIYFGEFNTIGIDCGAAFEIDPELPNTGDQYAFARLGCIRLDDFRCYYSR